MQNFVLLALIIVLVSGLIAYIGDWVGRKLGRKRLTMFGLRPRYTAIVISVVIGMLIAMLTLATTFAVSAPIRRAFLEPIDQIKADLRALELQKTEAEARIGALEDEVKEKQTDLRNAERELRQARAQTDEIALKLAAQSKILRSTNTKLSASVRQRQQTERTLTQSRSQLRDVQGRLEANQQQLRGVQKQLGKARSEYDRVRTTLGTSQDTLVLVTQQLLKLETEVLRQQQERDGLAQDIAALNSQIQVLNELARTSFAPLAFTAGQELISGLIPSNTDTATRQALVGKLLEAAGQQVRQRGTELPEGATPIIFLGGTEEQPRELTFEEAVQVLAERIGREKATADVIVRLAPVNNVPVDGPALIAPESAVLMPNYAVFVAKGEVARIRVTIMPDTATADVVGAIVDDLLREKVPDVLRNKNVPMLTRRFDPELHESANVSATSLVPWADLLAAADKACTQRGSTVEIVARTRAAMNRYDPLHLMLTVEPVQGK